MSGAFDNLGNRPQEEVLEFVVDSGTERTYVVEIPWRCDVGGDMVEVAEAEGERFKISVIEDGVIGRGTGMGIGDVLLISGAGISLLQMKLEMGVVPEEKMAVDFLLEIK